MLVQHLVQPPHPPRSRSPVPPSAPTPVPNTTSRPTPTSAPVPLQLGKSQWEFSKPSTPQPTIKPNFLLRPATSDDAAPIAQLGGSTFAATFGFSMPANDLNAYLEEAYSLEAISRDICEAGKHFLVATSTSPEDRERTQAPTDPERGQESKIIGFVQLTQGTTDPCLAHYAQSSLVELQRLYVSRDAQGLGVGKSLMSSIETKAGGLGYRYMWLGVWEGNFIAQRVYESLGFERVGEHEFRMGRCIQTDWIMVKEL